MKETKVYVDELPKSCSDCPCYDFDMGGCQCKDSHVTYDSINRFNDCPLKLLHDHDKELVAKVLNRVKKELDGDYNQYRINYILDQIQKEYEK